MLTAEKLHLPKCQENLTGMSADNFDIPVFVDEPDP